MTGLAPAALTGLWRLESFTTPDGFRDEGMSIYWLQGPRWFCGLRIPSSFSFPAGIAGEADLTDAAIRSLAAIQGSAGQLSATPGACLWTPVIRRHPPGEFPDEGRYVIEGDTLIEDGVHFDYREIWKREPDSAGARLTFELLGDAAGRAGIMTIAGDLFMAATDGLVPPPASGGLEAAVDGALKAGRLQDAIDLLSMTVCLGSISGGWTVSLSTHPWRQGQPLWRSPATLRFDPAVGMLGDGAQTWRLIDGDAQDLDLSGPLVSSP